MYAICKETSIKAILYHDQSPLFFIYIETNNEYIMDVL